MGRQAEAKLTSEERRERAFQKFLAEAGIREDAVYELSYLRQGWDACWRYLQEHLAEYIAS